ncbi:hypothetical protein DL769_003637 [Monosporascus sp. CRB-8-3]|nr:hypothetical protein DL769_003637 [Monosporascus sp. CRB-8-3]
MVPFLKSSPLIWSQGKKISLYFSLIHTPQNSLPLGRSPVTPKKAFTGQTTGNAFLIMAMEASGIFHFFSQLPVEIQLQIWKIHREHKPKLRHTLVQDFYGRRTYEAFDVKQHVYVNTLTSRKPGERTRDAIVHPEAGEEITKVQLENVKCWTGHYGTCALAEGFPDPHEFVVLSKSLVSTLR